MKYFVKGISGVMFDEKCRHTVIESNRFGDVKLEIWFFDDFSQVGTGFVGPATTTPGGPEITDGGDVGGGVQPGGGGWLAAEVVGGIRKNILIVESMEHKWNKLSLITVGTATVLGTSGVAFDQAAARFSANNFPKAAKVCQFASECKNCAKSLNIVINETFHV